NLSPIRRQCRPIVTEVSDVLDVHLPFGRMRALEAAHLALSAQWAREPRPTAAVIYRNTDRRRQASRLGVWNRAPWSGLWPSCCQPRTIAQAHDSRSIAGAYSAERPENSAACAYYSSVASAGS